MVHVSEPCSEARAALERHDHNTLSDSALGGNAQGHITRGGSDIRIASGFPPVLRPKAVPRS